MMINKPHYAVCDGKSGVKFPRTPEGLQAAIELAQELGTWVAASKRFIERIGRWECECVWESQELKDTHNRMMSDLYKPRGRYDSMWNVSGYYNDNDGHDIRDRD